MNDLKNIDINQLIDTVREKRDCSLSIFVSNVGTSINIYPYDPNNDPHWIPRGRGCKCSSCGSFADWEAPYCNMCGEKLRHSDEREFKEEQNDQT